MLHYLSAFCEKLLSTPRDTSPIWYNLNIKTLLLETYLVKKITVSALGCIAHQKLAEQRIEVFPTVKCPKEANLNLRVHVRECV